MSNKVVICGINTSSLPRCTNEESKDLLAKIACGDTDAKDYFILCNMRLVLSGWHDWAVEQHRQF